MFIEWNLLVFVLCLNLALLFEFKLFEFKQRTSRSLVFMVNLA